MEFKATHEITNEHGFRVKVMVVGGGAALTEYEHRFHMSARYAFNGVWWSINGLTSSRTLDAAAKEIR